MEKTGCKTNLCRHSSICRDRGKPSYETDKKSKLYWIQYSLAYKEKEDKTSLAERMKRANNGDRNKEKLILKANRKVETMEKFVFLTYKTTKRRKTRKVATCKKLAYKAEVNKEKAKNVVDRNKVPQKNICYRNKESENYKHTVN